MVTRAIILLIVLFIIGEQCHMCLVNPKQRGTMNNINQVLAPDCALDKISRPPGTYDNYCGGRAAETPAVTYTPNTIITVVFQKNNNHFTATTLSSFKVFLLSSTDAAANRQQLHSVNDSNTPELSLYVQSVQLPNVQNPHAVLQVIYDAPWNNTDYVYYQCADIAILSPNQPMPTPTNDSGLVAGLIIGFILVIAISIGGTCWYFKRTSYTTISQFYLGK